MKTSVEQLNACEVGYLFGQHLAKLNPNWPAVRNLAKRADDILTALGIGPRIPSMLSERMEMAIQNGFNFVRKAEDVLVRVRRGQSVPEVCPISGLSERTSRPHGGRR